MSEILTERSGSILRIQLNRPQKKNAMTSRMYVTLAEILDGAASDDGSSYSIPAWAGHIRASELFLLGLPFGATRALELGIVTRVVPDRELLATATATAEQLAAKPAGALQASKRLLKRTAREQLEQAMRVENEVFSQPGAIGGRQGSNVGVPREEAAGLQQITTTGDGEIGFPMCTYPKSDAEIVAAPAARRLYSDSMNMITLSQAGAVRVAPPEYPPGGECFGPWGSSAKFRTGPDGSKPHSQ